jgi:inner membrane protein
MNGREHILGGVIATTITYVAASAAIGRPVNLQGILIAAALGVPAGLSLDLFEPAIHPHHRGVCHSQAAACGLGLVANHIWNDPCTSPEAKVWCMTVLAGVGSHFALDAQTPKGLPLLGLRLTS